MTENELSNKIIGIAIELQKILGPGLLESAYENAFSYDLKEIGIDVMQQVPMPFVYKEIKSVKMLAPVHYAQLLTYLKLSNLKLRLLINFNTKLLKDGIHRVVNNL